MATTGSEAMSGAYAKLDWAAGRNTEMGRIFTTIQEEADRGTPFSLRFVPQGRPAGLVIVYFGLDRPIPVEIALLAGDLIHNTRTALDHVVARLKDHFGGDPGQGGFPVCRTETEWQGRVVKSRRPPLNGLEGTAAFDFIYDEQPLKRSTPDEDELVLLNRLDNDDKHRLLHAAFVYPAMNSGVERGTDFVEVRAPTRVIQSRSLWEVGQPLESGTAIASYLLRGRVDLGAMKATMASNQAVRLAYATGVP